MSIGQPHSRLDGRDKVTGAARYSGDLAMPSMLYAAIVPATLPRGRVLGIDTGAAMRAPGVAGIMTHENAPRLAAVSSPPAGQSLLPLQAAEIFYEGQPVALVLADSLERATAAARLVRVTYEPAGFETDFRKAPTETRPVFFWPADSSVGDFAAGWATGAKRVEAVYATADRHHNTMEPSATLATWENGALTLHDSVQGVVAARAVLATAFGVDPARVRVRTEFVGGGFGCKGWVWPHQFLAAMAAQKFARPVKLVLTRAQTYTAHGYQPASEQRIALAARADGTLTGIRHQSLTAASRVGRHVEGAAIGTRALYACPAIETTHRVAPVDRGDPTPMRAPLEGVGQFALEIAMDEVAYEVGIDPLELRLRNYAETDPSDGKPFSSKKLRECYLEGARRFGWSGRSAAPRSMREGRDLVGWGMATAIFSAFRNPAKARISIDRTGSVLVESSTQEIGTGVYTVIPQIAAEELGIPLDRVRLVLGDTTLPEGPMTAGSTTTLSVGAAVMDAAQKLKQRLAEAGGDPQIGYGQALSRLNLERLSAEGEFAPSNEAPAAMYSFGAIFAEVRIDADIPVPRVSRVVAVYNAGRIINPKTARSQMTGGVMWGIGQALLERTETDHALGRFMSKNLAGYLLPSNADAPQIDASFVEDFDGVVGPVGARGIGELGAIGIGPAIANAVFHATGIRVREAPIRPEHLLVADGGAMQN